MGMRVKHATRTDWGLGEVIASEPRGMVTVFFEDAGIKQFNPQIAKFISVEGEEADSDYLTALVKDHKQPSKDKAAKGAARKTFASSVENFLSYFPRGFQDPSYISGKRSERSYKENASLLLNASLPQPTYELLLAEERFDEVCARAKTVMNRTNLISPYEKIWLNNSLADESSKVAFCTSLHTLLYSLTPFKERFEQFAAMLYTINSAKWPIATYFPFLSDPENHFFLKPEVTKSAAAVLGLELNYKPELNWLTYSQALRLAEVVKTKLLVSENPVLVPRDMIDVQSFIWIVAPGYS